MVNEITKEIRRVCDGQAFITQTQLATAMGVKDPKSIRKYLIGLEAFEGRRFLIRDVAARIKDACVVYEAGKES